MHTHVIQYLSPGIMQLGEKKKKNLKMLNNQFGLQHANQQITGTVYAAVILQIQPSLSRGSPSPRSARRRPTDTPDDRFTPDYRCEPDDRFAPEDRCECDDRLVVVSSVVTVVLSVVFCCRCFFQQPTGFFRTVKDTYTDPKLLRLLQIIPWF